MKPIRLVVRLGGSSILALTTGLFLGVSVFSSSAQTVSIRPMTWTPRSDWINVKTDSALTIKAVGDGIADDTPALMQALALAATTYTYRPTVYLPPGTYRITSTLAWSTNPAWNGVNGVALIGCGSNTTLKWNGPSGGTMFKDSGVSRSRYIGITWDGNSVAANGISHISTGLYQTNMRHENEAFLNFTGYGIYSGDLAATTPTAEVMVWNCLFYNCATGLGIGINSYNYYMWQIQYCEFQNCATGINGGKGKAVVVNTRFQNSSIQDISAGSTFHVRRTISTGSKAFFVGGQTGASYNTIIQDCWINSWTNLGAGQTAGAIRMGDRGPSLVADCLFTNPPNTSSPINFNNAVNSAATLSNNYCPKKAVVHQLTNNPVSIITVPPGSLPGGVSSLSSTNIHFLNSSPFVDSSTILDVTKAPYYAARDGVTDATAAIQSAINDAITNNNGTIVYLPAGGSYKLTSSLSLTGSNYSLQGAGYSSVLKWTGPTAGSIISASNIHNVSLEQFFCSVTHQNSAAVTHTATSSGTVRMDGVYYTAYLNGNVARGFVFSNLPAGTKVLLEHIQGPLTVENCGPAEILGNFTMAPRTVVSGTGPKTGFLGATVLEGSQYTTGASNYDIQINDNQDFVASDYYQEAGYNHLSLERGAGTGTGRVTLQGFKQNSKASGYKQINVNNYAGRLTYGPQYFSTDGGAASFGHTGTNPFDLILTDNVFKDYPPASMILGPGARLVRINSVVSSGASAYLADIPVPLTSNDFKNLAQGLDHIRELGWQDLKHHFKIIHGTQNPTLELDLPNPSPTSALGYTPNFWALVGTASSGSGVRNMTVIGTEGSPFGKGNQSLLWVDSTGTSGGTALNATQNFSTLPTNTGAVWTFDIKKNSAGGGGDVRLRLFSNSTLVANLHFTTNISAAMGGTTGDTNIMPFSADTWHRIKVKLGAPSAGLSTATLCITPWTTGGPGTTTTATINGIPAGLSTGFNRIYITSGFSPGTPQSVQFDNMSVIAGDTF